MTGVNDAITRFSMRIEDFDTLMSYRVQKILLVASHYDAFVLEEGGQLTELIVQEYRDLQLNLRFTPEVVRVKEGAEALQLLEDSDIDIVVATPRLSDMPVEDFLRQVRVGFPKLPLALLAAHAWDLPRLDYLRHSGEVDWLFLWQGDVKTLLAMIKQLEDHRNAAHDVFERGVQVVILVEDEVRYYSAYLPHIYTEVTKQTGQLMEEGFNLSHRLQRMRARPKILLAQNFEQAWELFETYLGMILGVISDVTFPHDGELDPVAGIELARRVRDRVPDMPYLLQSSNRAHETACAELDATFLYKGSPNLLAELRAYIRDHFGFGDFTFRLPDGSEVARARDMREMVQCLRVVPDESLLFHAGRNHFSAWLKARTEFELASLLKPRKVSEFGGASDLREYLISNLSGYLSEIQRHVIVDFKPDRFDDAVTFAKIGEGSLGGKGRGLAFLQKLLGQERIDIPGVEVAIPQTVVISSEIFEDFIERNAMRSLARRADEMNDEEILDQFRGGRFPHSLRGDLAHYLEHVGQPLAVRSSSILEDSLYQPFAGVYATVMVPNNHPSLDVRLAQLLEAIKVVFASTYFANARDYLRSTPHRIEEERMAVIVQRLVGSRRRQFFYPTFAGVASSYNFYPFGDMKPDDGVVQIALGLGKSVVEGYEALRFCPRYPEVLPQFSSVKDVLRNAQRRFYALDMERRDVIAGRNLDDNLVHLEAQEAIKDGAAQLVTSTYLRGDDTITSGIVPGGAPLITFTPLLKGRLFPLPQILCTVLDVIKESMGCPVETEFAMDMQVGRDEAPAFNVLQVRPMVVEQVADDISFDAGATARAVVFSENALGHGRRINLHDLVVVRSDGFDRASSQKAASIIEKINRRLREENRSFILVGPGRWGSRDPWLGIPVSWSQISGARAIVETDFPDLEVEPSQGSHFFHNITCFGIAYLTVHENQGSGRVDWSWLSRQNRLTEEMDGVICHIRLETPAQVLVDGKSGHGVILPAQEPSEG